MKSVETTGKTVDEAVREALIKLKASRENVDIEVLDPGAKGFLGIGSKPVRISVVRKFDPLNSAKTFLRECVAAMGLQVEVQAELVDTKLFIDLKGPDIGVLIGKRGQTLDSLQYLTNLVVNKGLGSYITVNLDSENYRKRRKETLEGLAVHLAKKAKRIKKNVVLEPMSSYERRIIHSTLQSDKFVSTYSEGDEPYRKVVIVPK